MKVCLVASTFPTSADDDDTRRFVLELAVSLAREAEVVVLAPHAPGAARRETIDGVRVERFPYFRPTSYQRLCYGPGVIPNLRASWLARVQAPLLVAAEVAALRRLVRRETPDVVNSHWLVPQGLVAGLRAVRGRTPHLATVHAAGLFALEHAPLPLRVRRGIAQRFVLNADRIFTVSSHLRDHLSTLVGMTSLDNKARVVPMGVDTARFGSVASEDVESARERHGLEGDFLLFVGRLTPKKGVEHLVDAAGLLADDGYRVPVVVVGDGPLRVELERRVRDRGADVRFAGGLPRVELDALYTASTAVVVPSVVDASGNTEGTPVVALEALAAGSPVIASVVGGLPDVVRDEHNGYVVPPGDPGALAAAIGRLLEDKSGRARMAQNAAESGTRYDWDRIGDAYLDAFRALAGAGRGAA